VTTFSKSKTWLAQAGIAAGYRRKHCNYERAGYPCLYGNRPLCIAAKST
jgi:hypothetical protein